MLQDRKQCPLQINTTSQSINKAWKIPNSMTIRLDKVSKDTKRLYHDCLAKIVDERYI